MAQSNSLTVYPRDLHAPTGEMHVDDEAVCEELSEKVNSLLAYVHELHDGFRTTDHLICLNFTCIDARRIVRYGADR